MNKYIIRTKAELLRKTKEISIPFHGSVSITMMAKCFIDNRFFQRLYNLKQLGTCDYIYPGAKHTRGEHSIGTYYLADRIINRIKVTSDECKMMEWLSKIPELKTHFEMKEFNDGLNNWIMELIKIAALCHDIGHGPYSHMFDDAFIKNSAYENHPMSTHEARSCAIVEMIVYESEILSKYLTRDDIKFVQSLIDSDYKSDYNLYANGEYKRDGFVYQIVSNNINGLDVDKYDYIGRDTLHTGIKNGFDHTRLIDAVLVIDDRITYPEQAEHDIYNLFSTRHLLHRILYGHKGVVAAQYIICEIMKIIDKVIEISKSITDFNKFILMTDQYIINYMNFILEMKNIIPNPFQDRLTETDYVNLKELQIRLQNHNLYPHIGTILSCYELEISDTIVNKFNDENHMIFKSKVGFVSGEKSNPLDRIYIYKTKEAFIHGSNVKAHLIKKKDISFIISDVYQEYITMIFRKDNELKDIFSDKEKFQKIREFVQNQQNQ